MKPLRPTISGRLLLLISLLCTQSSWAAAEQDSSAWGWNLVIALIVLVFTLASAALPIAALRQWRGYWRGGAVSSLLLLLFWVGLIIASKLVDSDSHRLWPFEIFAWGMLNMIYMVALMTCKRIIEKEDERRASSS